MSEAMKTTREVECPDLYRGNDEAPRFLKLPSTKAFNAERRRIEKEHGVKIKGRRAGRVWLYHRRQLDAMARFMVNVDLDD